MVDSVPRDLDELVVTIVADNATDTLSSVTPGLPQVPELVGLLSAPPIGTLDGHEMMLVLDRLCVASHGFSAVATARRGDRTSTVLFDVGPYGDVWLANAARLGIDLAAIEVVFISHWHSDHTGGVPVVVQAIASARAAAGLPPVAVDVHPDRPDQRGLLTPLGKFAMLAEEPTIDALAAAGGAVVAHDQVHPVADLFLASGAIPRVTDYETGLTNHYTWRGGAGEPDPEIQDERLVAAHVRGRGTTVLTACSHAGVVNVGLEAGRLVADEPVDLLLGGFHLAGAGVEPRIEPTVRDLVARVRPRVVAPGHCTGWRAASALARALPAAFAPSVVGSRYRLAAAR